METGAAGTELRSASIAAVRPKPLPPLLLLELDVRTSTGGPPEDDSELRCASIAAVLSPTPRPPTETPEPDMTRGRPLERALVREPTDALSSSLA